MIAAAVAILIKLAQHSPVSLSHWLSQPDWCPSSHRPHRRHLL